MLHNRFLTALLGCVLFFTFFTAVPVNAKSIVLNKAVLTDFFEGISIEINKPIVVSRKAELFEISGEIDVTDPYKAIETVCNKTNLIWYDNGSAIYVYLSSELKSEFVPIATENDFQQIVKFLKLSNLYSLTYPLRYTKGAGYVSGPPMYITVVRDAVAAYYNGLAADEKPTAKKEIEVIKMFPLRNRFVTDMRYMIRGAEKVVEGALSILNRLMAERPDLPKNVTIVADPLNNAIYIRALAKDLSELETLINEIDVIREQIQLSLWIIDIDSSEIKEIGTSLEGKISNDVLNIGLNGGSVILDQSQTLSFVGAVNLLESDKKAKVLSRPVLITQNNTPAVIDTNETIYVRLLGERDVSLKEITYGTILSVTPRVVKGPTGNDIEMMVEIEDGNQTAALIDGIPNIRRSVISTVGRISDSQSLLLGGFVRKEVSSVNRGVPVLKNIPVLKYLFSMDVQNTSSVMRLFMIEPKIVEDPVAEFNRSKIINLQSEPFFKAPKAKDPFSVT
ncbi:MAG: type III secretion system outer membrane ring subunit SctC, partial [Enterovibrio sp.]